MSQASLFDFIDVPKPLVAWEPPTPPSLDGIQDIELDCETNGLKWFAGDRPIGIGLALPRERTFYLPWGHKGGGNLPEETVKEWARRELRGKRIANLNTRFDVHMLREWGVDLEAQGCVVTDVGHHAALLDDHRQRFSLESLVDDFLPGEAKVRSVGGRELDPTKMAEYHAGVIAVRAEADVRQVQKLRHFFAPKLSAENLGRVKALEDDVIYPVCEMEKNGALIDVDLLDQWVKETAEALQRCYLEIYRLTGLRVEPTAPTSMAKLFRHLNLPITETATGRPSFTGAILKSIDHPVVKLVLRATKLASLRSKYLIKYQNAVDRSTGILRYSLHQLRAQKDQWSETTMGTVSGRFSSTEVVKGVGLNIQQIMKAEKQETSYGEGWIIRQLHRPAKGTRYGAADAMQVEYRLFADKTGSKRLAAVYAEDPLTSFHKHMWTQIQGFKADVTYRRTKDLNFAQIYGAGLRKKAWMLDFITAEQFTRLMSMRDRSQWYNDPALKETREIEAIYNRLIPEVKPLLEGHKHRAETEGVITTILGRRSRFPNGMRSHKALNADIQGSAADIMKLKLAELHRERKHTGFLLRFTVHDEVDGDMTEEHSGRRVWEVLNQQSVKTNIPILWEVSEGATWAEAGKAADPYHNLEATKAVIKSTKLSWRKK